MKQITDANGFAEALRDGGKVYYREEGRYVEVGCVNPFTHPDKTYITIDEELEKLLTAKYNAEIIRQDREYSSKKFQLEGDIHILQQRINEFNSLPWYKRMWRKL